MRPTRTLLDDAHRLREAIEWRRLALAKCRPGMMTDRKSGCGLNFNAGRQSSPVARTRSYGGEGVYCLA
jgi:hypothetical protein